MDTFATLDGGEDYYVDGEGDAGSEYPLEPTKTRGAVNVEVVGGQEGREHGSGHAFPLPGEEFSNYQGTITAGSAGEGFKGNEDPRAIKVQNSFEIISSKR